MINLKGNKVSKSIIKDIKEQIANENLAPNLTILIAGSDPASLYYAESVRKKGNKVGIKVNIKQFSVDTPQDVFCNYLAECNADSEIDAIMIQKPLPRGWDDSYVSSLINPAKDVDGINPLNAGLMTTGQDCFLPCTAEASIEILRQYDIDTSGKKAVVIGRSNVIGKPVAILLLSKQENATVTICHSRTNNISEEIKSADIVIAAIGKAEFVKAEMLKKDAVVIDVGINEVIKDGETTYVGDVDYAGCSDIASAITPVPGGVGTATTAVLLKHVLKACKNK